MSPFKLSKNLEIDSIKEEITPREENEKTSEGKKHIIMKS